MSVTVRPMGDAWIYSRYPSTSYPLDTIIFVGDFVTKTGTHIYRSLFKWDLTAYIGYTFTDASLFLTVDSMDGYPEDGFLARITQPAWNHLAVTWLRYDTLSGPSDWTNPGGDYAFLEPKVNFSFPSSPGPLTILSNSQLKDYCQSAVDLYNGYLHLIMLLDVEASPDSWIGICSVNHAAYDWQPKLVFDATPPAGLAFERKHRGMFRGVGRGVL